MLPTLSAMEDSRRRFAARFARLLASGLLLLPACSHREWAATFEAPAPAGPGATDAPFLKAHLRSGDVYVFDRWRMDTATRTLTGNGLHYDAQRKLRGSVDLSLPWESVVLVETNRPLDVTKGSFAVMGVLTAASLAVSALCLTNPKACFGSCPTFYTPDGRLVAEGFSSSVARVLAATDVDALTTAPSRGGDFMLRMTNEALETHFVDGLRVLAAPRAPGTRILRDATGYFSTSKPQPPLVCTTQDGLDCRVALLDPDDHEYKSDTDGKDLATRETLELRFPATAGPAGLMIAGRNSLLNTYLFYQTLAFMGRRAGEWFTKLETSGQAGVWAASGFGRQLGDIDIEILDAQGRWRRAGAFSEVGPIAREVQLVRLPDERATGELRVRVVLTRGNWRVDHVALVSLGEPVQPLALVPERVERDGRPDVTALAQLAVGGDALVTYPGDAYTLHFTVPPGEYEIFLESTGYYYEWMRAAWLAEEDEPRLTRLLLDPAAALRELAPAYRVLEPDMDRVFWASRWGGKP
jgi:hypothetical protein